MDAVNTSNLSDADHAPVVDARAVFLTHYIPLYQVRVLQEITRRVREFPILLSTPIEPNREFRPDWSGLDVSVQKTITLRRKWKHATAGFDDALFVHLPYDTRTQLKRIRPDVVVSHELGARSLSAARYCRRSGAKLVLATFMSEHTEQGRGGLRDRVRRHLLSRADAITYNGPSCRDYLLSLGAPADRLFHLPYAADDRTISKAAIPECNDDVRRKLICIGQLSQRKGVLPLVAQASDFCRDHDQTLEITFVGDGPLRGELDSLAAGRATESSGAIDSRLEIHVLGNQPAAELPRLMSQHGAVIAPTLADEWLLVVNEAMHAGLPVIGSVYAQAVTTLIRDGHNGWCYDPLHRSDDPAASYAPSFADAVKGYLKVNTTEMHEIQTRAREDITDYSPAQSADGVIQAIRHALGETTR